MPLALDTSILVTDKITVEVVYTAYLNEEAQVFNASATSTDNKNSVDCERPRRLILIFTNLACALLTRRCSANIIGSFQCDAVDLKKVMKENTSILVTDKITVEVVYTAYLNEEAQAQNQSEQR